MKKKRIANGYSRVTSVLGWLNSAWKEYWWKKVGFEEAERVSRESQEFGKKVHKLLETYLIHSRVLDRDGTKEEQCAITILDWLSNNQVKPLELEVEVKDPSLKLIGHFDLLAEINGEKYVIDYKTSKKVDRSYALQLAAYAHLIKKTLKIDANKGIVLRVDKETAELEVVQYDNLKPYWIIFKAGLTFFKFMNGK